MSTYVAIRSEGGLIPPDTLDKIAKEELPGQKGSDFGLHSGRRLSDEIARAWSDALDYWSVFQRRQEELPEADVGTTLTRRWMSHLLDEVLGYRLELLRTAPQIEGKTYAISHRADDTEGAPPVHVAGLRQALDRRPESGRPRTSPQALIQEYLNRTEETLWGVVTNGLQFRHLRDSTRSSRPTYLEFDLAGILDGQRFNEFALFFRICHRSRLPKGADDAAKCLLEQYYQASIEEGARVRDHLRDGVEQALLLIGTGLLRHPDNTALRAAVEAGELNAYQYYQQLLRLIYRLLFLMVAEERRLIVAQGPENDRTQRIYDEHYSVRRLRDRAEHPVEKTPYGDLWINLQQTFRLFDSSENPLGIPPLNGDLFGPEAIPALEATSLSNHILLDAVRYLSLFAVRGVRRRVNYAGLDVEELGSVYESLLDFQPVIETGSDGLRFDLATGMERKSTGSYYTHPDLVGELIKSALVPVMRDRLEKAKTAEEKGEALIGLSVCDPACGSGHFLLAAARRIGRELARARTGEEEPTPEEFRGAVREVIRNCIYGVDVNPLAVDLCKLALWIEGHNVGLPLTFLDHRIRCGNSLIGIFDERPAEVPDEAFTAVTGDVKKVATAVRKRNRYERSPKGAQQLELVEPEPVDDADVNVYAQVAILPDDSPDHVHAKKHEYEEWQNSEAHQRRKLEADTWCAAFFWPLTEDEVDGWLPTTASYLQALAKPSSIPAPAREKIDALAQRHRFFHWCLEFPDVFARGGFDVVLGNPPWEQVRLQAHEFFAARDPSIATAPSKAARDRLIAGLRESNKALYDEYRATFRGADGERVFLRNSARFPLTAVGDINTYAVFAEMMSDALSPVGRVGSVLPSGVAVDDTTKKYFGHIVSESRLLSLYDFGNRAGLFPSVRRHQHFCLFTAGGPAVAPKSGAHVGFFFVHPSGLCEERRLFHITPEQIQITNPNTHTTPVPRTDLDLALIVSLFRRVPVLVREGHSDGNPWDVDFLRMLDVSGRSAQFRTREQLEAAGGRFDGHQCVSEAAVYVPVFDAKMAQQYCHRASSLAPSGRLFRKVASTETTTEQLRDPHFLPEPLYWIDQQTVDARLDGWGRKWLLGYKDVTGITSVRLASFAIIPRMGVGNPFPLVMAGSQSAADHSCLLANLNSVVIEYILKMKLQGLHVNLFHLRQVPVLPPSAYAEGALDFIVPRVLELTYTAWDLKPFAEDLGYDGPPFTWDPDRRALLRAELDAYYAHLYGLNRKQLRYILDPHDLTDRELEDILDPTEDPPDAPRTTDFPGETFRVLKQNEIKKYGEYRTQKLVLDAWDRMHSDGTLII